MRRRADIPLTRSAFADSASPHRGEGFRVASPRPWKLAADCSLMGAQADQKRTTQILSQTGRGRDGEERRPGEGVAAVAGLAARAIPRERTFP